MIFGEVLVDEAEGAILAHTVRAGSLTVKKGVKLSTTEVGALGKAGIKTVIVARLEDGDVIEGEVAQTIATQLAGAGVDVMGSANGRCNLHARVHGVVSIDKTRIDSLNGSGDGVVTATVSPLEVVEPGRPSPVDFRSMASPTRSSKTRSHGSSRMSLSLMFSPACTARMR